MNLHETTKNQILTPANVIIYRPPIWTTRYICGSKYTNVYRNRDFDIEIEILK